MSSIVGFVGIGNMGAAMARNLLKAGHRVVVCDRSTAAMAALESAGATSVTTPAQLATIPGIGAVITMLPSPGAVKEAYLGEQGMLSVAPHVLRAPLLIDSSTVDPMTSRALAQAAAGVALHPDASATAPAMLDAPVSGGVGGAAAGTLTFMVGGPDPAVAAARPLLQHMGHAIVHCGGPGAGQAAKLCNNLVLGISMAAVAEGLALGQRLGIDAGTLSQVLNGSSGRCWSSDTYNPVPGVMEGVPASREYTGGFAAALMQKDLGLALHSASECGAPLPLTAGALELYARLAAAASPATDFSGVFKYVYGGKSLEEAAVERPPEGPECIQGTA